MAVKAVKSYVRNFVLILFPPDIIMQSLSFYKSKFNTDTGKSLRPKKSGIRRSPVMFDNCVSVSEICRSTDQFTQPVDDAAEIGTALDLLNDIHRLQHVVSNDAVRFRTQEVSL